MPTLRDLWSDLAAQGILNPDLSAQPIVWTSAATQQAVTIYGQIHVEESGRLDQKKDGLWEDRTGELTLPIGNYQSEDTFLLPTGETWMYAGSNKTGNNATQTVQIEHHVRTEIGRNRRSI